MTEQMSITLFVGWWLLLLSTANLSLAEEGGSEDNTYRPISKLVFNQLGSKLRRYGIKLVDPAEAQKEVVIEFSGEDVADEVDRVLRPYRQALLTVNRSVTLFEQTVFCSTLTDDSPLFLTTAGFVARDAPLNYLYYGRRIVDPPKIETALDEVDRYFKGRRIAVPMNGSIQLSGREGKWTDFAGEPIRGTTFNLEQDLNYYPLEETIFIMPTSVAFKLFPRVDGPPWVFEKEFDKAVRYRDGSVKLTFLKVLEVANSEKVLTEIGEVSFEGDPLLPTKYELYYDTSVERFGREWLTKSMSYEMWADWEKGPSDEWYLSASQMVEYKPSGKRDNFKIIRLMHSAKRLAANEPQFREFFSPTNVGQHVPPIDYGAR